MLDPFGQNPSTYLGEWAPAAALATPGTSSNSAQYGQYQRIGNFVSFVGNLTFAKGTGTGVLTITGLPFTANGRYFPVQIFPDGNGPGGTAGTVLVARTNPGATTIAIASLNQTNGVLTALTDVNLNASATMYISGTYVCA